ncbi:MAG: hypothetical protein NVS3B21_26930 [Acidimicrobiales bacterium]
MILDGGCGAVFPATSYSHRGPTPSTSAVNRRRGYDQPPGGPAPAISEAVGSPNKTLYKTARTTPPGEMSAEKTHHKTRSVVEKEGVAETYTLCNSLVRC